MADKTVCPNCKSEVSADKIYKDIVRKKYYCELCKEQYRKDFPTGKPAAT